MVLKQKDQEKCGEMTLKMPCNNCLIINNTTRQAIARIHKLPLERQGAAMPATSGQRKKRR
jgi:hypothetical protein